MSIEVDPRLAARHRTTTVAEAKQLLRGGRPAERAHQDPGHRRGPAGHHRGARRGHQRQRHADLLPRALPRGDERLPHRARAGPRRPARTCPRSTRSPRSSSPASTPRSTSGSTRSAPTRPRRSRARPASPTPGWPTRRTRRSSPTPRWKALDGRGRAPAAPAVGVDRRQGPGLPRHAVRRPSSSRPTRSTRCRRRPSTRSPTTARSPATPSPAPTRTPRSVLDALEAPRRLLRRRRRRARARGRRQVREVLGRAARRGQRGPGRRPRRRRTPRQATSDAVALGVVARPAPAADAIAQHVPTLVERPVRQQAVRPGRHPVGSRGGVRVGHPAVVGRPGPRPRGRWSARSPRCATSCAAEGVDHVVLCGMGGSSLAPEVICATAGVELVVLDSSDPDYGARRAAPTGSSAPSSWSPASPAPPSRPTPSGAPTRRAFTRRRASTRPSASSSSPTPAARWTGVPRQAGYRVVNADPNVGGRYSALTAFGLVP